MERFTYWKRPWHRWVVLAAAVLQLLALGMTVSEYREIAGVWELIFSAVEFEKWSAEKVLQCALYGMAGMIFLGTFLIGTWSRSKQTAKLAEGTLLLIAGIGGEIIGLLADLSSLGHWRSVWFLAFAAVLAAGACTIWKNWRDHG